MDRKNIDWLLDKQISNNLVETVSFVKILWILIFKKTVVDILFIVVVPCVLVTC